MPESVRRLLLPATIILLTACWLGGGVTADNTAIDEWLQLLALPVLLLAVAALAEDGASPQVGWGIAVAGLILLLPILQLLPIGGGTAAPARQMLQADLASAGVQATPHWSLAPFATEQGLWALLPALAAFLAAAALTGSQRRRLLQAVLVLLAINVIFAFFQAGLPRDSALRLYQDFDAGFGRPAGQYQPPRRPPASSAWCWRWVWLRKPACGRVAGRPTRTGAGGTWGWRGSSC